MILMPQSLEDTCKIKALLLLLLRMQVYAMQTLAPKNVYHNSKAARATASAILPEELSLLQAALVSSFPAVLSLPLAPTPIN